MRYVYYFDQVYKGQICSPILKSPEKIVIHTVPELNANGKCKPFLEIVNGTDFSEIWSNKSSMNLKTYKIMDAREYSLEPVLKFNTQVIEQKMVIQIDKSMKLSSDLYFRVKHRGQFKNKLICRFALNPAFISTK